MNSPYNPSDQLLKQIAAMEDKINKILALNDNKCADDDKCADDKSADDIMRYKKFIKSKKSLLCKLDKLYRDIKY